MQHYGIPTRLLDWSEGPLVALYFAVTERPKSDGAIWCLLPAKLNKHANIEPAFAKDIPGFGTDGVLDNYLPSRVAGEKTSRLQPAAAIASRQFQRVYAQLGTFTITHQDQTAIESIAANHVGRFKIPKGSKPAMKKELAALRITQLTLFPELTSAAAVAKEVLQ
jgi:hypothetical protein